jgi:hypothetical protein
MAKYKLIIKQIEIIEVDALTAESAIKKVKDQIYKQDPRALVEIDIVEEGKIEENEQSKI